VAKKVSDRRKDYSFLYRYSLFGIPERDMTHGSDSYRKQNQELICFGRFGILIAIIKTGVVEKSGDLAFTSLPRD